MSRIDQIREKLAASVDSNTGKPLPGYRQRVVALRAEEARLTAPAPTSNESVGVDTPADPA